MAKVQISEVVLPENEKSVVMTDQLFLRLLNENKVLRHKNAELNLLVEDLIKNLKELRDSC